MRYALLFLCALLFISGCAPLSNSPSAVFRPVQAATAPTPAPTPAPSADELAGEFLSLWHNELNADVSAYLPETFFDAAEPWDIFGAAAEGRLWLPATEAAVKEELAASAERALLAFRSAHGELTISADQELTGPSWQLIYALMQGCKTGEEAAARIESALELGASARLNGSALLINISAAPLPYREALRIPDDGEQALRSRCFLYSYVYTVYGADAAEVEYELPAAECSLSDGIVWPLASHTRLRKTWYADRDDGRRKHTGTDIWAKADTEIYSCTDGVVTYVGNGDGTGFAVVVTDGCGYEYHYYHMIRLSDFLSVGDDVSAGALIGHVGNTGNSDLDHLHLTIVAPDGKYINPYPYLKAVEPD